MLEEILKELEEIKKHKWAPSLVVVTMIEKLTLKIESSLKEMEKPNLAVKEMVKDIKEILEDKPLKKKISPPEPSIYTPNGGIDVKKPTKGA